MDNNVLMCDACGGEEFTKLDKIVKLYPFYHNEIMDSKGTSKTVCHSIEEIPVNKTMYVCVNCGVPVRL